MLDVGIAASQNDNHANNTNRRHRRSFQQRNGVLLLLVGIAIGWIIGFCVAMICYHHDEDAQTSIPLTLTNHHLRFAEEKGAPATPLYQHGTPSDQQGWKLVHIFKGMHHDQHMKIVTPMAQAHQDELAVGLLRNKTQGYFVDLAAHDATYLSNTFQLEQNNAWSGLCIEANPAYWNRLAHRHCQIVAAVIGQTHNAEIDFRIGADGALGGIEHKDFDNKPGRFGNTQPATKMYTVTLAHVLERFEAPAVMYYLSLDIEGAEFFVMQHFPFDRYRFHILTVERPKPNLIQLFQTHGYEKLCRISQFGETLWVHNESKPNLDLSVLQKPGMCH